MKRFFSLIIIILTFTTVLCAQDWDDELDEDEVFV